jgi:hypothetical protein
MSARVVAIDVGGANVKAAHTAGAIVNRPFALWRTPMRLGGTLRDVLHSLPDADALAVTMTGELCDCFVSKREGVHFILDHVEAVVEAKPVYVWQTDGRLLPLQTARQCPQTTAASNWHALATYCVQSVPDGAAILIDVGSTTTDIIPLRDGRVAAAGATDAERLQAGELVYTGYRRTPLCALLGRQGAAELFATTLDIHLILGRIGDDPTDTDTADGRPATRAAALARLARMTCEDAESCSEDELVSRARSLADAQLQWIHDGLNTVLRRIDCSVHTVVLSGSGDFLARDVVSRCGALKACKWISLAERWGVAASNAACAYALARLTEAHIAHWQARAHD